MKLVYLYQNYLLSSFNIANIVNEINALMKTGIISKCKKKGKAIH